mmetsp:Transcript_1538/g.3304  ORF Transcript_1538/g.3304 Transcript_1538/m.3304 type:complete len:438 (+) Transcript_1538:86-1399(+)
MSGWIISLIVLVVAICAGLAAFGFKGRITTVGVDLGTTFSVVGIYKNGKVEIVTDKGNHQIFPSIVSYLDNGEIKVGYDALPHLSTHPDNTIYNAKRFIGRSLSEADVQEYAAEHPYHVVESHTSNYSEVGFVISASGHVNKIVAPEQIGTQVLKYLMKVTAEYLGHDQVNKAVIAVPAKFSPLQRQATAEAYKKAGLKVIRLMEEPTAAAVAYQLHKRTDIHHILVYDFGGGTLDVSILYVAKGSVEVYATDGDDTLGGSDIDLCLFKILKDRILQVSGLDITSQAMTHETSADCAQDASVSASMCTEAAVHTMAEDIKKKLSSQNEVLFSCTLPSESIKKEGVTYTGPAVSFTVSREQDLQTGCSALFERSMLPVQRLLDSLEMSRDNIDEIVLVGGTTRIPHVKQQLREYFGKELNDKIDPDVTVAWGAASVLD